jgi:DNA mismatch repair ATPase MutS
MVNGFGWLYGVLHYHDTTGGAEMTNKPTIINTTPTQPANTSENNKRAFAELGMDDLLSIKSKFTQGQLKKHDIMDYFVTDAETIRHRLDIFDDMQRRPEISTLFSDILPMIYDMGELAKSKNRADGNEFIQNFYDVRNLDIYVDTITKIHAVLSPLPLRSKGLENFTQYITKEYESEAFVNLCANLTEYKKNLRDIKSITVGINLNNYLQIAELGILSVNTEAYTEGSVMERFLSKRLTGEKPNKFISRVTPIIKGLPDNLAAQVISGFNSALNFAIRRTTGSMYMEVTDYIRNCSAFLIDLIPEINFLLAGYQFIMNLKENGIPVCKPMIAESGETSFNSLINPHLTQKVKPADIVSNDISFDANGMIFILTGANSGGKTVFLFSLGIAQILFQLGLWVPARVAALCPVDEIYTHFTTNNPSLSESGRLEQECATLSAMLKEATPKSLILMDETFSSTGSYEGASLAEELLKYLSFIGCKCVFSTHLHELTAKIDGINDSGRSKVKVDSLTAETPADGKRSYKIIRKRSDGLSHAKDIAAKHGLLFDY